MTDIIATEKHREFFEDMKNVLQKHSEFLPAEELLAITSIIVGKLIAVQDQRMFTGEQALEIVIVNIQKGNQDMINDVFGGTPAGHA